MIKMQKNQKKIKKYKKNSPAPAISTKKKNRVKQQKYNTEKYKNVKKHKKYKNEKLSGAS